MSVIVREINPGDPDHSLTKIVKVISGDCTNTVKKIADYYGLIVQAGLHEKLAPSKVAEACKVIENTQRDINIALMNELSMIFNIMKIDTNEVIEAASTKWNFLTYLSLDLLEDIASALTLTI